MERNYCYMVEYFKVGYGGSVRAYGKKWKTWPWCKWVKVWHYVDSYGNPI
jgi:hypothetical protein